MPVTVSPATRHRQSHGRTYLERLISLSPAQMSACCSCHTATRPFAITDRGLLAISDPSLFWCHFKRHLRYICNRIWECWATVRSEWCHPSLGQGSPTPGTGPWPLRNLAAQQEVSGGRAKLHLQLPIAPHCSHYLLNHRPPPTPPPRSMEKLSSTRLAPGARKVGDRCSRGW